MRICNYLFFSKARKFLPALAWLIFSLFAYSQKNNPTPASKNNPVPNGKTLVTKADSTATDTLKNKGKEKIDAEINYTAEDSIVFLGNGTGFLHGKGDIKYKNIELKADFIRVKTDSSLVFARGTTDSTGTKIGEPVFSEGKSEYASKELKYNLRSKKGYIRQAVTQQGEGYVISDRTKKTSGDI
ncbi:MAG TPA: hypothetical protein VK152_09335, partial [Paludibacter sp.]|nr:hypothetical protein [Paludibacter sp.]